MNIVRNNFTAGRLSPFVDFRHDLAQLSGGCRDLTNFRILPYGGIQKRPGTAYITDANSTNPTRLIPFEFSTTVTYLIEFGNEIIKVYDGSTLKDVIVTTVDTVNDDIWDWQFCQVNDIMYFVHPKYKPKQLSRLGDTNWSWEDVTFRVPPITSRNSDTNLNVRYDGTNLISNSALFDANDINREFYYVSTFPGSSYQNGLVSSFTSAGIECFRSFNLTTTGTWSGKIELQKSLDNKNTWESIITLDGRSDRNVQLSDEIGVDATDTAARVVYLRVKYTYFEHTGTPKLYLWTDAYEDIATFKITAINSPTSATATQIFGRYRDAASTDFAKSAFSDNTGYPYSVAIHEQRLCFGGTPSQPQTLWLSKLDDLENFSTFKSNDDYSARFTIAAQDKNRITYLQSARSLVIGTIGGEYTAQGAGGANETITPSSIDIKRHSNFGSSTIPGILYDDKVLFVIRQNNRVREIGYSFENDGYVSTDLSLLAEDMLEPGIVNITLQTNLYNILYCVLSDGSIAAMTYERNQSARGWSLLTTNGNYKDLAVIRSNSVDEIYVLVQRGNKQFIERFNNVKLPNISQSSYLDNYRVYSGSATTEITGATNLSGYTVDIYDNLNGSYHTGYTVDTDGTASLDFSASYVTLGIPFTSSMETTAFDAQFNEQGRRGKYDRMPRINCQFISSSYCLTGGAIDKLLPIDFDTGSLYSGNKEIYIKDFYDKDKTVFVQSDKPLPLTILGFEADYRAIQE